MVSYECVKRSPNDPIPVAITKLLLIIIMDDERALLFGIFLFDLMLKLRSHL